jgi:hypothetical protein
MRVLIENYRSWEIYFDTDNEEFHTVSNEYDTQQTKKSYASAKKYIDDYLKENQNFKPIKVQKMSSIYSSAEFITLIGLRKDGAFMYEDSKGNKQQLSKYNETDFFLVNSDNDVIFKELDLLYKERNAIDDKIKYASSKVIKVDVKQIRKNLIGE